MSKPVKIIIETTLKGKQPTIHASGALTFVAGVRIKVDENGNKYLG